MGGAREHEVMRSVARGWCAGARTVKAAMTALLALSVVSPVVTGAAEPAVDRILVHADVTAEHEVVRLGEMATLRGRAAALADLDIASAPRAGATRSVPGTAILERLQAHGVDLDHVRYVIPAVVHVRRAAQEVPPEVVRGIVEEYVSALLDPLGEQARVRSVETAGRVRLPPGPYTTRATTADRGPIVGKTRVTVEFLQDGAIVHTAQATALVDVFEEIYVARRAIPRGAIVSAEDLLAERRTAEAVPRGAVSRAEDVIGMEARVAISPLTPLRVDQLGAPVLVRRGDVVTLRAESAGLQVSTRGEVREDAARDAQVRVWNLASRREVVGRVVDAQTVTVAFR